MNCDLPSLDGPWSITESSFRSLVRIAEDLNPKTIVEFGSGASSIRLSRSFPQAKILSLESDPVFYEHTLNLKRQFDRLGSDNLQVSYRPLRWQWHGPRRYLCYARELLFEEVDIAIIDGPPGWTLRGREACLYQTFDRIRLGGLIFMDDYERSSEKSIVENWEVLYPGAFQKKILNSGHRICVLKKVRDISPRWYRLNCLRDNWISNLKLLVHERKRISKINTKLATPVHSHTFSAFLGKCDVPTATERAFSRKGRN